MLQSRGFCSSVQIPFGFCWIIARMCYHKLLCDLAELSEMWSQIINWRSGAFAMAHSFTPFHFTLSTAKMFRAPSRDRWPLQKEDPELWRVLVSLPRKAGASKCCWCVVMCRGCGGSGERLGFGVFRGQSGESKLQGLRDAAFFSALRIAEITERRMKLGIVHFVLLLPHFLL